MNRHVRVAAVALALAVPALMRPASAHGQAGECDAACKATFVVVGAAFGTGTAAVVGRLGGGFHTVPQALLTWGAGFGAATVGMVALSGNEARQRRAVYGAGIGAVGGAIGGLAVGALIDHDDPAVLVAATLIGAAVGVAVGGIVGGTTWESPSPATIFDRPAPAVRIDLLRFRP